MPPQCVTPVHDLSGCRKRSWTIWLAWSIWATGVARMFHGSRILHANGTHGGWVAQGTGASLTGLSDRVGTAGYRSAKAQLAATINAS